MEGCLNWAKQLNGLCGRPVVGGTIEHVQLERESGLAHESRFHPRQTAVPAALASSLASFGSGAWCNFQR